MRKKYRITACVGHNLLNIISAITEKALGIFYNNSNVKGPPLPDRPSPENLVGGKLAEKPLLLLLIVLIQRKLGVDYITGLYTKTS